jgi:hypothetical protein
MIHAVPLLPSFYTKDPLQKKKAIKTLASVVFLVTIKRPDLYRCHRPRRKAAAMQSNHGAGVAPAIRH